MFISNKTINLLTKLFVAVTMSHSLCDIHRSGSRTSSYPLNSSKLICGFIFYIVKEHFIEDNNT